MFYYMKFRIGVCIPSTCDQSDMDSISAALSSSLRLNITIPDCRVKQTNLKPTRHQFVGGLIFALVVAVVLLATLIDCFKLKWKQLEHQDFEFIQEASHGRQGRRLVFDAVDATVVDTGRQHAPAAETMLEVKPVAQDAVKIKIGHQHHRHRLTALALASEDGDGVRDDAGNGRLAAGLQLAAGHEQLPGRRQAATDDDDEQSRARARLLERLAKHWTWMSFSLITNFRLYFHTSGPSLPPPQPARAPVSPSKQATASTQQTTTAQTTASQRSRDDHRMVACLNGIRVLSLCWVIVANSYLTLDPRATKRLTKTREAPRDFLFQLVVQASLAIETFFFLSGLLMSLSFVRRLVGPAGSLSSPSSNNHNAEAGRQARDKLCHLLRWIQFYVHRYVRMTPPTMLVIALSMYAYHYGDGPLWFEATQRVHQQCTQNWWRHLLHVANFIDTRQMCFIHYWYIAADMQLFLFAPLLMYLVYKYRHLGYCLIAAIGGLSMGWLFYTTYTRSLPPTLLFYSTDPE
jgi:hypothetical protein